MAVIRNPEELKQYFGLVPVAIGDLQIDVLRSETPVFEYEITEHPVEGGSKVADHRLRRPIGVTLDITLTDTNLNASSVAVAALTGTFEYQSWRDKKERLYELRNNGDVFDVVTDLDTYKSMVVKVIRPNRTPAVANCFECTVELRELQIVASEVQEVDDSSIPQAVREKKEEKHDKANSKGKKFKEGQKKVNQTPAEKDKSILKKLKDRATTFADDLFGG